jgi:hypothetical protein
MFLQPLTQIVPEALFLLGEFKIHTGLPAHQFSGHDYARAVLLLYSIFYILQLVLCDSPDCAPCRSSLSS